jgi:hypothetical protein
VTAPYVLCSPLRIEQVHKLMTVVALVELSIMGALPSKRRPEVHKSRISLSYSRVYIYFDPVIRIS